MIGQKFIFSVRSDLHDGTQYAGTVDQAMLAVEGIAVGVAERNHFLPLAIEMEPVNLVDGFVILSCVSYQGMLASHRSP